MQDFFISSSLGPFLERSSRDVAERARNGCTQLSRESDNPPLWHTGLRLMHTGLRLIGLRLIGLRLIRLRLIGLRLMILHVLIYRSPGNHGSIVCMGSCRVSTIYRMSYTLCVGSSCGEGGGQAAGRRKNNRQWYAATTLKQRQFQVGN